MSDTIRYTFFEAENNNDLIDENLNKNDIENCWIRKLKKYNKFNENH
uniref:Uncharacterized protein n=1 Tax=viral metagenome TaxID=1070528 RepID=A0A6C0LR84_9ZZZZ